MRNRSSNWCYFRVMKRTRVFLIFGLLFGIAVAQNLEFVHYLQASQNPEFPYSIYVWNPGNQLLEISTKHDLAKLSPVTSGLGRETVASVHFAPDVASTLVLPAKQNFNNNPLNFRLETDAPIGVYNLALEFPGWKPDMHPIALNSTLQVSTKPVVGDQFLYVGVPSNQYILDGKPLSPEQLNGAIFTLKALEANKAVFAVENLNQNIMLEFQSGKPFPGLALMIPDPALESLATQFDGRQVWQFGGFHLECHPSSEIREMYETHFDSFARVKRMLRLAFPAELHLPGGYGGGGNSYFMGDFVANTPIAIQFEQVQGLKKSLVEGQGIINSQEIVDQFERVNCDTFTELFADPWQLERVLSLNPASPRVPRKKETSLIGLDRWQVAWLWGFPSFDFGTRAELMKRPVWKYENIPFPAQVTFKNDKVIEVEIPRLP
jgi:hypothetical protein